MDFSLLLGMTLGTANLLLIKTVDKIFNGISLSFMSDLGRKEGSQLTKALKV